MAKQEDELRDITDYAGEYLENLKQTELIEARILKLRQDQADYAKIAQQYNKEGNDDAKKEAMLLEKSARSQLQQVEQTKKALDIRRAEIPLTKEQIKIQELNRKLNNISNDEILKAIQNQTDAQKNLNEFQENENKYRESILENLKKSNITGEEADVLAKQILKNQEDGLKAAVDAANLQKEALTMTDEQIAKQEQLNKLEGKRKKLIKESLSFVDDIAHTIEEIPIVGGILSEALGTDELKEKMTEIASKEFTKLREGGAGMGKSLIGSIGSVIKSMGPLLLTVGALVAAFKLIEFAVHIDKETTALARNLGVSKDEAHDLHHEMIEFQRESDNALMTIANQTKAMSALAIAAGTNAAITKDMVDNQVLLANNLGVAEESAAKLNTVFKSQGLEAEKTTLEIVSTVEQINKATGAGISQKEVFEDIAKVSTTIRAQFKGNFKELTLQVVKAKQLGLTLDRIVDIGRESLDVESSMTAEMQARVLTGKQLNLNEFRAAALRNDTDSMMKELVENAGSLAEFTAMDAIARESMANAFGLSQEELAGMLEKQELLNELGVESLDNSAIEKIKNSDLSGEKKEQLLSQIKMADTTEKMAKATESLKNIFAGLAGALQPVLNLFTFILDQTQAIKTVLYMIGSYIAGKMVGSLIVQTVQLAKQVSLKTLLLSLTTAKASADAASETAMVGQNVASTGLLSKLGSMLGLSAARSVAETSAATAVSFGAMLPIILGAAAAIGGMVYSFMDDGIQGPVGPTGYSRTLTGPEGSIAINDKDTIVAGTNLSQIATTMASNSAGESTSVNISMARVESLLETLITKVDQPTQIHVGNRVIDELEKKTSMTRRFKTSTEQGYGLYG